VHHPFHDFHLMRATFGLEIWKVWNRNGDVLCATKFGNTAQYASWIGKATGLPVLNANLKNIIPTSITF
jgi:hypothetical protein